MQLIVNTDGASRGNPGPAAYGFIVKSKDGVILHEEGKRLGVATNNIAEYSAVLAALEYIEVHYGHKLPHEIEVVADSLLIVEQLSGNYKIKNPGLIEIYRKIKPLEAKLGRVKFRQVPRKENFLADRMANVALDRP